MTRKAPHSTNIIAMIIAIRHARETNQRTQTDPVLVQADHIPQPADLATRTEPAPRNAQPGSRPVPTQHRRSASTTETGSGIADDHAFHHDIRDRWTRRITVSAVGILRHQALRASPRLQAEPEGGKPSPTWPYSWRPNRTQVRRRPGQPRRHHARTRRANLPNLSDFCHRVSQTDGDEVPTSSRKASSRIFGNWPLAGTSLVAGVGFEPTTSGL
jgi:hypothetical protein